MTAEVAILTGGTSGLGRFVAQGLVRAGYRLVLVARDTAKARSVRDWLLNDVPGAVVEIELADLSLLAAAQDVAARITARHPAIAVLVLNAGTFQPRREVTLEGHERVLAVNHLVPFVLMRDFAPALFAGGARVVVVGSSTSDRSGIDPDNLELVRGWTLLRAYARSKLALMMAAFTWADILGPAVSVNVVHPGTVATDLVRAGGLIALAWRLMRPFVLTAEQGAAVPLRAALDPSLACVSGRYLTPSGFGNPNPRVRDAVLVRRVWQATEALAGAPRQQQRKDGHAAESGGRAGVAL